MTRPRVSSILDRMIGGSAAPQPEPWFRDDLGSPQDKVLTGKGLSMWPAVWPRDELQVDRRSPQELSSGQIVAYLGRDGRLIAHRLLGVCARSGMALTQGDRIRVADEPVSVRSILGTVEQVRRSVAGLWIRLPGLLWRRRYPVPRGFGLGIARGVRAFGRGLRRGDGGPVVLWPRTNKARGESVSGMR